MISAPLTEVIDHAGCFIQMSMASLPIWLEGVLNRKYRKWRELEYNADGSARYIPAGVRVLETTLRREYGPSDVAVTGTLEIFRKALAGEELSRQLDVGHPKSRDDILFFDKRTTFGVVEMTTGCGRRCNFCLPDLNPQIDLPKEKIGL